MSNRKSCGGDGCSIFPVSVSRRQRTADERRRRKLLRAIPGAFSLEQLEDRQLMSLLGVAPGDPNFFFDTTGKMNYTYNSSTGIGDLQVNATAHTFTNSDDDTAAVFSGSTGNAFTINFLVDANGNPISAQTGPNLIINGKVTDPDTSQSFNGVLLEGDISQFGFNYSGTTTNNFDFRFTIDPTKPGLMAADFAGSDIGVTVLSLGNTFTGSFTQNWIGGANAGAGANGFAGAIPPLPQNQPPSSISGRVYEDLNFDGVYTSIDQPLSGVQVILTGTDSSGNPVDDVTTTDSQGLFEFDNLAPSNSAGYTLTETQNTVPSYLLPGVDQVGSLGGNINTFGAISQIPVVANESGVMYEFGWVPPSQISGNVYFDENDNGIEQPGAGIGGVTVTLTGTNYLGTGVSLTTTTLSAPSGGNPVGYYQFTGLLPSGANDYTVTETPPPGYGPGIDSFGTGFTNVTQTQYNLTVQTPLPAPIPGAVGTQYNFGELLGSISGIVFQDTNDNGVQDVGEPNLANVNVDLIENGATIGMTQTNTAGAYTFTQLFAGTYEVEVIPPNGAPFTIQTAYQNGGSVVNSIVNSAGVTPALVLPGGGSDTNVDAGVILFTPSINTTQQPATAIVGSSIADEATVSGGFNPTGSVTFELFNNAVGSGTPLFTDENVAIVNGVATSTGYTASATGTDYWVAIYSGDANNYSVTSPAASEPVVITPATPAINTAQQPATAIVGSSIADQATVSGGFNPTGTVSFELFDNAAGSGTPLFTEDNVTLVNGVATSTGYTATATGTDYWVATYNGDSNNSSVTSPAASEPVMITPATPAINTAQQPATAIVGSSIADQATVSGGFNPSGTVNFELFNNPNGTGTPLFTADNVALVNGVATSPGYTATATGTDYWVAIYNGDSNNSSVTSPASSEPVIISPATPAINTTQQPATAVVGSSIADQATVTGGFNPSGTVVFELFSNSAGTGTPLFTSGNVAIVNGVATSPGYTATATGTDYWVAIYSGDTNNSSVTSPAASEPVVITPATPAINTTQQPATAIVGSSIADQATVSGGFNPSGTVNFELFNNPNGTGTPLFTSANVAIVNGAATSPGYTATATGTDYWVAIYSGDSNNSSVTSPTASEPVVITPASPAINTSQQPATAVVGSSIADKATVTGGDSPTGSVTFELFNNSAGTGTPLFTAANVALVNGAATSPGYTATATGTDYWVAIYNGNSNNSSVTSPAASEPVVITPATPAINTTQQPATAVVGSSIADKATITGGDGPTGSVTFELFSNSAGTGTPLFTSANVAIVNGAATSPGYTATATGTDYWVAIYSGDSKNSSITSPASSEPVVITPATPAISTTQQPATAVVGSSIADKATVSGGDNPTGSVTFELFSNSAGTGTPLFTSANITLVNGAATSAGYTATATGTDYWVAIYSGNSNNASVTSPASSEPVVITPSAPTITTTPGGTVGTGITISGTKFLDLTGNGFSSDDTPQSGVTIDLYKSANGSSGLQTGAGGDTLVGTTTTGANGAYSFSVTGAGTYYVTESVPTGYIQTGGGPGGTAGNTYYTVNAGAGYNYSGYNFDDFMIPTCLPTNITYKVTTPSGHSTTVTNLAGNTQQGDTVTAMFTVPAGMSDTLSLVSYIAPTSTWSDANAYQQQIYQVATGTFAPGSYTLTVQIPNYDYQIDFFCGAAINQLEPNQNGGVYGPDSANVLYHAEDRFLSSDNSGTTTPGAGLLNTAAPTVPAQTSTANATVLSDSATLSGGMNPSGSITFYLMAPGSTSSTPLTSAVYTDKVTVTNDGTYSTATGTNPGGYVPTVSGTYEWVAVYSGDTKNSGATSAFGSEPEVATVAPACVSGTVYVDYCNNCCMNSNDAALSGITVQLLSSTGTVLQSTTTNSSGVYSFSNIAPGTYTIAVPQSQAALNGYQAGKDAVGTVNGSTDGSVTATSTIGQVTLGAGQQGINYNFGETANGQTLCSGDCGSIGFWCSQAGQNLMCCLNGNSNCTNLGNWLCKNFGNLYGATCGSNCLSGKTNAQVCQYFNNLCNNSAMACNAQVLCTAINCYVTNTTLCGSVANSYGFNCSSSGCGSKEFNVWCYGSAFGVSNNCTETVLQMLQSCNAQSHNGSCFNGNSGCQSSACNVFTACNQAGNIGADC